MNAKSKAATTGEGDNRMPKFAANLSFLFQDLDFLDRFEAAKRTGFQAVEYLFPYDYPASDIAERLETLGLTQARIGHGPVIENGG